MCGTMTTRAVLTPKSLKWKTLKTIYYDPNSPGSYGSVRSLYRIAKEYIADLKISEVKYFLQNQNVYTLHQRVKRKFQRRKTICRYINYQLVGDLIDVKRFAADNDNVTFLLSITDCLSRYIWVTPLKSKTASSVLSGLKDIFSKAEKRSPNKIINLQFDQGSEVYNKKVKGVNLFSTQSDMKASLAENSNKLIMNKISRYITAKGTRYYLPVLQNIVQGLNSRFVSSIAMAPKDVNSSNEKRVFSNLFSEYFKNNVGKKRYNIGQKVRITKYRGGLWRKGYLENFNPEIFTIASVKNTIPVTYTLMDENREVLRGTFYGLEITPVGDYMEY